MSEPRHVPSAAEAIAIQAGVTLKRMFRGRLIWFIAITAGLPAVVGLAISGGTHSPAHRAQALLTFMRFIFVVVPPMLVGASIGDELGSKSATYLWSRPLSRWTILAAKLVVLAPMTMGVLVGSYLVALALGGALISAQALGAVALGGLSASIVVAGVATLGPRHAIAFSLLYMFLVDLVIGLIPWSLQQLSISHQTNALADLPRDWGDPAVGSSGTAAIWLIGIAAVWLIIALRQLRTREA